MKAMFLTIQRSKLKLSNDYLYMNIFSELSDPIVASMLLSGKIGVIRTDTLYGIVCIAHSLEAVKRVFACKGRDEHKSPIVLISSSQQLFDAASPSEQKLLSDVWPGKVSVILNSISAPSWIERGNSTVAYRLPADTVLQQLITRTGPLIAPSANPQGQQPARTIQEAVDYFGERIDFYVDGGEVTDDTPSQLLKFYENGQSERLR